MKFLGPPSPEIQNLGVSTFHTNVPNEVNNLKIPLNCYREKFIFQKNATNF